MVGTPHRGNGLGGTLMRLALGHLLFEENPLELGESVISHVHAENNDPRGIMSALKFRLSHRIRVPGSSLPGLRTNAAGYVEGDEFELVKPDTLNALADWCGRWKGQLKDGRDANIVLRPETSLPMWAEAFRDMASS